MLRSRKWKSWLIAACVSAVSGCAGLPTVPKFGGGQTANQNEAVLAMARVYEKGGQMEQAKRSYHGLIQRSPNEYQAYHRLGVILAKEGKFDEAGKHFDRALALAPNNSQIMSDMGYALYLQGRLDASEQLLRRAIAEDPKYIAAHNNLGLVLGRQGRFEDSYAAFRTAGNEAQASANLAYVHAQHGNLAPAESLYSRALTLDNEMKPAAEGLIQVAQHKRKLEEANKLKQPEENPSPLPNGAREDVQIAENTEGSTKPAVTRLPEPKKVEREPLIEIVDERAHNLQATAALADRRPASGSSQVSTPKQVQSLAPSAEPIQTVVTSDSRSAADVVTVSNTESATGRRQMAQPVSQPPRSEPFNALRLLGEPGERPSTSPRVEPAADRSALAPTETSASTEVPTTAASGNRLQVTPVATSSARPGASHADAAAESSASVTMRMSDQAAAQLRQVAVPEANKAAADQVAPAPVAGPSVSKELPRYTSSKVDRVRRLGHDFRMSRPQAFAPEANDADPQR